MAPQRRLGMRQWKRTAGQWALTAMLLLISASVWAGNVSPLIQDSGTRVGIGTAGPFFGLVHIENSTATQALFARTTVGSGTNYGMDVEATGVGAASNVAAYFNAAGGTGNSGIVIAGPAAGAQNYAIYSSADAASYFSGAMGLGTTTPAARLHLRGADV